MTDVQRLRDAIRDVPNFPKAGILFKDITPVLADAELLEAAVRVQLALVQDLAGQVDKVLGLEARGFLFGPALARGLKAGFVPARKPGKLPAATRSQSYGLEYGEDLLEVHLDAFVEGERVLVVDDLLATGGTAEAACALVEAAGAEVVGCLFLIELASLNGRDRLGDRRIESVIDYA